MRARLTLSLLLLGGAAAPAFALPLAEVADPRPASAVADPLGRLTPAEREAIDRVARDIARGEIVVVVVDDTEGQAPRGYGRALFNRWSLGAAGANDGVLLLAALDDRKAEIVLGSGIDGPGPTAASERLMAEEMVPRFRAGDPGGALLAGARGVAAEILGAEKPRESAPPFRLPVPSSPTVTLPVGLQGPRIEVSDLLFLGPFLLVGLVGLLRALVLFVRRDLRGSTPIRCPACRSWMLPVGAARRAELLSEAEHTEEQIGSVRHRAWACRCGHVQRRADVQPDAPHAVCPSCQHRTGLVETRVLMHATPYSPGQGRRQIVCLHCGQESEDLVAIAYRSESSSSLSDFERSSTFARTFPEDRGGRSSGGGASGSW